MSQQESGSHFGQIISEISLALSLLGADSFLQGAVGSWRDSLDDPHTLDLLKTWNAGRRERIERQIKAYRDSHFWADNR